MRVISVNLNGIRAATKKGYLEWIAKQDADIVCMQEVRAQVDQMSEEMLFPEGYHSYFHDAEKKGYSGVAIYSRAHPDRVRMGLGSPEFDVEGRYIQADFGDLSVISVYLPSGSSSEARQEAKYRFLDRFMLYLQALRADGREYIICGDWNIAHKEIDLKNWRSNQKNSGFLPEEREWMTRLLDEVGFVDVFRQLNQEEDQYTWWSNRGQAWAKNVGWRIDYHIATPGMAITATREQIYKDERFSDHAPLTIDYDYELG